MGLNLLCEWYDFNAPLLPQCYLFVTILIVHYSIFFFFSDQYFLDLFIIIIISIDALQATHTSN